VGIAEFNLKNEVAAQTRGLVQAWLKTHDDAWMQNFCQLLGGIKDHYHALALGRCRLYVWPTATTYQLRRCGSRLEKT
jgi:hypothetical protein